MSENIELRSFIILIYLLKINLFYFYFHKIKTFFKLFNYNKFEKGKFFFYFQKNKNFKPFKI